LFVPDVLRSELQQQNDLICAAQQAADRAWSAVPYDANRRCAAQSRRHRKSHAEGRCVSEPASVLRITFGRGIWRVTLDGAFYGDYRTRGNAIEGADAAANALRAKGRKITILTPAG